MPYRKFTKKVKGTKKYCTKNKNTGKVVCYGSKKKRATGIRIRRAIDHGWKPTRKR